jgi:hypothetical protein
VDLERSRYWILDDARQPVPATVEVFGPWMETAERIIRKTQVNDLEVSTVFLGIDHNFVGGDYPVLYETMVFPISDENGYCDRYSTEEEAIKGHEKAVAWAQEFQHK